MTTINDVSTRVSSCRLCGSDDLQPVLSLGTMALTGVFPSSVTEPLNGGPLELVRCVGECGLVQLAHAYPRELMYGPQYGYRSALNRSMVEHLQKIANYASKFHRGDLAGKMVVDVGSNDGTLLGMFPPNCIKIGVDPIAATYPPSIIGIPEFFSVEAVKKCIAPCNVGASVLTTIAMFYDIADPLSFASDVRTLLAPDGVWVTEQSYLPTMISRCAYDTICHEHLAYYGLRQLRYIAKHTGLKIVDFTFDNTNGGSFCVVLARDDSRFTPSPHVDHACRYELRAVESDVMSGFAGNVQTHRHELRLAILRIRADGRCIFGYGASTKGNVILQYCGLTPSHIGCFAEVNPDKFCKYTPGSGIPIMPEQLARSHKPDYFLVMPWHFRDTIIEKEHEYLRSGGKLLFPLPTVSVHSAQTTELVREVA